MSGLLGSMGYSTRSTGFAGIPPAGTIIQTKTYQSGSNITSSGSTNMVWGAQTSDGLMTNFRSGNHCLVHLSFQCNISSSLGGFYMVARGNYTSGTIARTTFTTHADNLLHEGSDGADLGMSGSDPHVYTTSGGHSYYNVHITVLDRVLVSSAANNNATLTNPRYSLGSCKHPSSSGELSISPSFTMPITWTLQEIQV